MKQNRRAFLRTSLAVCGAAALGTGLLNSCGSLRYAPFTRNGDEIAVNKAEFLEGNSVALAVPQLGAPIFLHKTADESYTALLMLCTHKRCDVSLAGAVLRCPCHGSTFAKSDGHVLRGPADKNLKRFETRDRGAEIAILIGTS